MNDDALDKHVDKYISELVDAGALSPSGMSADGEFLYSMDIEKMTEISPEFFAEAMRVTSVAVTSLQKKGLVEYVDDGAVDGSWNLTEAGTYHYDSIDEAVYAETESKYNSEED